MVVEVGNNIRIRDPDENTVYWCKKNLVVPNPDYAKKQRMGFWTGNTPRDLYLYEKDGTDLILPFGVFRRLPEFAPPDTRYVSTFKDYEIVWFGGTDVPLYDYQRDAVESVCKSAYGILQSAAGSGKTQMGVAIAKHYSRKTLWLTHTLDLLNQSKARAEQYIDKSVIGTISEGKVNIGSAITFATVQTMCRLHLEQYRDMWDVIIVDECHRVAGSPTQLTQFAKVLNSLAARHKYGLSATVHRADGLIVATKAILGDVIYSVPEEAVEEKIMRVGIQPVRTGTPISRECLDTDGTLIFSKLVNYLTEDVARNKVILNLLSERRNHPSLILTDRVEHAMLLWQCLPKEMRDRACVVTGKTKKILREQYLDDMRDGRCDYLFSTFQLAKEGLDIPRLERLYLVTPQKDYAVITQAIGRVARVCDGKADPVVYDFVDDIAYCAKAYKKRCTSYRKAKAYFLDEEDSV